MNYMIGCMTWSLLLAGCLPDVDKGILEMLFQSAAGDTEIPADGKTEVIVEVCNEANKKAPQLTVDIAVGTGSWVAETPDQRQTTVVIDDNGTGCAQATWLAPTVAGVVRFEASSQETLLAEETLTLVHATPVEILLVSSPSLLPAEGGVTVQITVDAYAANEGHASDGTRLDLQVVAEPSRTAALNRPFLLLGENASVSIDVGATANAICVTASAAEGNVQAKTLVAREGYDSVEFCNAEGQGGEI